MKFERLLDKEYKPSDEEIIAAIGEKRLWLELNNYIEQNYDFTPELVFYGKKYGWTTRYRNKSKKTLISLFPEHGAFSALVVLGKKEVEKIMDVHDQLSPSTQNVINDTEQLHDGRWLWIRVLEASHVEDIKQLLKAKRKPKIIKQG